MTFGHGIIYYEPLQFSLVPYSPSQNALSPLCHWVIISYPLCHPRHYFHFFQLITFHNNKIALLQPLAGLGHGCGLNGELILVAAGELAPPPHYGYGEFCPNAVPCVRQAQSPPPYVDEARGKLSCRHRVWVRSVLGPRCPGCSCGQGCALLPWNSYAKP
jgi:hypothetical protein